MSLWRLPTLIAEVSNDRLLLTRADNGCVFDEPSHVAVEDVDGRLIVCAVGGDAQNYVGRDRMRVVNPFASMEPLFTEFDYVDALFKHAIRAIFEARSFRAPRVFMHLADRSTALSESELERIKRFAAQCGLRIVYVTLGGNALLSAADQDDQPPAEKADYIIRPT